MGRKIKNRSVIDISPGNDLIHSRQFIYAQNEAEKKHEKDKQNREIQMELMEKTRNKRSQEEKKGIKNRRSQEGKMKTKTKTRNRSSPRLRDMSWKSPRLMERMDIIYQSRPF